MNMRGKEGLSEKGKGEGENEKVRNGVEPLAVMYGNGGIISTSAHTCTNLLGVASHLEGRNLPQSPPKLALLP